MSDDRSDVISVEDADTEVGNPYDDPWTDDEAGAVEPEGDDASFDDGDLGGEA